MTNSVRAYIYGRMSAIPGYMNPLEALLFAAILDVQNARGLAGDVCEIGTYFGRSYFLMRHLMAPAEKILSIDIYEDTGARDTSARYRFIRQMANRLGFALDDSLLLCADSRALSAQEVRAHAGPFRFVHIDGGHHHDHVAADAKLAVDTMAEHGVVCFDDFFNPLWPEVTSGVYAFIAQHPEFAPVFFANMKVFLARRSFADAYKTAVLASPHMRGMRSVICHYESDEAILFEQDRRARFAFRALELMRLQRLGAFVFR